MVKWGFSPSVRLFEAAGCGCPIISDQWPGLDTIFAIEDEVLVAESAEQVITYIQDTDEAQLRRIGLAARERVLDEHSSARRAEQLEGYISSVKSTRSPVPSTVLASGAHSPGQAQLSS
jgi:spore maturation protein CgeB